MCWFLARETGRGLEDKHKETIALIENVDVGVLEPSEQREALS